LAKLSRVHESEVPKSSRGGVGRAESPAMGELRELMKDLSGSSEEWAKYELEGSEKEATIRQRLMQAASREELKIATRFDRDNQTFYFQVVGPKVAAEEDTSSTRKGRRGSKQTTELDAF
jgi:hypothetical protein